MLASLMSSVAIGVAAYVLADAPGGPIWSATIFAGTGINGISNWVAAAALFTAVLIPTVFAPLTGTLFQTASQAAMVGVGVGTAMAGAAAAPVAGAAGAGLGGIGGLGGLGKGMSAALGQAQQTIGQEAAGTMQSMGLGERLLYAVPHSLKNMAVVGTTGVLGAMGAYSAARSIATVAPLSSNSTVSQGIGRVNAARQDAAMEYETTTALHDANQSVGVVVFNAATAPPSHPQVLFGQSHALDLWHSRQTQLSPPQFLSQARQSYVINVQQYHALLRDHGAQAEFTENYKRQLGTTAENDESGNLTSESLGKSANLKANFETTKSQGLKSIANRDQVA
jgi:hypothetical protein